ncbi:PREDICTED: uncharacterized protein LOC108611898 [Drosophila arizonae]|uniref:Uncharacterized protein LOC108611898 n=1 Tax=Drosophila arizonae TaxID=7263 RepID=A0ABM1NZ41_DROAR|nr:PREDICTED: uncharacterized protein LOC108611898 [Drosophila arizonae]
MAMVLLLLLLCCLMTLDCGATGELSNKTYFVNSAVCKMPYVEPFTEDVLKIMTPKKLEKCRSDSDIIIAEYDFDLKVYRLHIREEQAVSWYKRNTTLECKYEKIVRDLKNKQVDNSFRVLYRRTLTQDFLVPPDLHYALVHCAVVNGKEKRVIQSDGIAFVQDYDGRSSEELPEKIEEHPKPSVLIFGIDAMSRINLRRTMHKTFKYLQQPGWYTLQGLNKVGDNTLPNLLAMLTGYSAEDTDKICDVRKLGCFDKLPFIWKRFKDQNYTTAMAEDKMSISTFNYLMPGFIEQPVDYYLRPLLLAMEKTFNESKFFDKNLCLGRHLTFAYLWDFAKQFIQRFIRTAKPMFGLFWTNSFSHDYFDMTFALDDLFVEYFKQFEGDGLFNRSIVILTSDHGMRYGYLRQITTGYLEERMPMFYIYLPPWFRRKYPHHVGNLVKNRNRLSSTFDIYMTLQHLLQLNSTKNADIQPMSATCPTCQSLFYRLPVNRTCEQAGITEKWCTCHPRVTVTMEPYARSMALAIIRQMNDDLVKKNLSDLCANFTLTNIIYLDHIIELNRNATADDSEQYYVIEFSTAPNIGIFEVTFSWINRTATLNMDINEISRLSIYAPDSECVSDPISKKFCMCKNAIRIN